MRARFVVGAVCAALLGTVAPVAAAPRVDPLTVLVQFRSAPTLADVRSLERAGLAGPFVRYSVVPAIAATAPASSLLRKLTELRRVTHVEVDAPLEYSLDRATAVTKASTVWDSPAQPGGFRGRGVTVAVIDSGIDGRHPDLRDRRIPGDGPVALKDNFVVVGRSDINEIADRSARNPRVLNASALAVSAPATDNGGHGTHVAGILAGRGTASGARYRGAAPEAKLVGLSAGEVAVTERALGALDWIHKNHKRYGIRVVSNSWAGRSRAEDPTSLINAAIRRLIADGIVVVFGAGNGGGSGSSVETSEQCNIAAVICVSNYDDRAGRINPDSSRGRKSNPATWPDLAAPGTNIVAPAMLGGVIPVYGSAVDAVSALQTKRGNEIVVPVPTPGTRSFSVDGTKVVRGPYASVTGASMSTPLVAGIVALMLEANPRLTPAQVQAILRDTATAIVGESYATHGYASGTGVVNADAAVNAALKPR